MRSKAKLVPTRNDLVSTIATPHPPVESGGERGRMSVAGHVGISIRAIRQKQGLTLQQLADLVGCKYQHIQRIELTGKGSIHSLEAIATALQHGLIVWPKIKM